MLAGGSGSGKSTLLRAASGLVPHFHGGDVRRAGCVVRRARHARARAGRARRGRRHAVPGPRDAGRDGHGALRAGVPAREPRLRRRGGGARGRGGGARARHRRRCSTAPTHELSGGELQRVALGAALAGRPRLVLLDEPTSQLDPVAGDELLGVLRRLNEEWGTAVLLAEHRLERCLPAADRVIALRRRRGRVRRHARARSCAGRRPSCSRRWRACSRSPGRAGRPVDGQGSAPRARRPGSPRRDGGQTPDAGRRRRPSTRRDAPRPRCALRAACGSSRGRPAAPARRRPRASRRARRVALMGRNGAGKSTLLRLAAGLDEPTRGRVARGRAGRAAAADPRRLLPPRPRRRRAPAAALERGRARPPGRPPPARPVRRRAPAARARDRARDGERAGRRCCLDEPTRGMDRARKGALAARLRALAGGGHGRDRARPTTPSSPPPSPTARSCSATAARWPTRRPPRCSAAAGTSRPRPPASSAARRSTPEAGAALLRRAGGRRWRRELDRSPRSLLLGVALAAGLRLVRAHPPDRAGARAGGDAGRARRARADRLRAAARTSSRRPTSCCSPATRSAARPGFVVGAVAALALEPVLRPGAVDAVADGRLGRRRRRAARCSRASPAAQLGRVPLAAACARRRRSPSAR